MAIIEVFREETLYFYNTYFSDYLIVSSTKHIISFSQLTKYANCELNCVNERRHYHSGNAEPYRPTC